MSKSLSIVIPAYNEERHIGACLDAIAAQTTPPDEVLVVNNNSTDRTVAIAESYPFVRVLHAKKQAIVEARNVGFNAVRPDIDIIGRIDADTIMPPGWIARIKRFYESDSHQNEALSGGAYFYNVRMPRFNGWLQGQLAFRINRFIVGHYILSGSNMAFLHSQWLAVRHDTCTRDDIHEDLDLAIHLHRLGYSITFRESLRVGVFLKRVTSQRRSLRRHMNRWPQTLKVHHYRNWRVAVVGNLFLWYIVGPFFYASEYIARFLGRPAKGA